MNQRLHIPEVLKEGKMSGMAPRGRMNLNQYSAVYGVLAVAQSLRILGRKNREFCSRSCYGRKAGPAMSCSHYGRFC